MRHKWLKSTEKRHWHDLPAGISKVIPLPVSPILHGGRGLSVTEAKQAIEFIKPKLIADSFASEEFFLHESYREAAPLQNDILHLLPSFDEYLISYKNRTTVLDLEHHPKAFNRFGTFYPVILHNGKVVGNWSKTI